MFRPGIGMVFEGTTGVYEMYLSFQFQVNEKELTNMRIHNGFIICWRSNLSYHDIRSFYVRSENALDSRAGASSYYQSVPSCSMLEPDKRFRWPF